MIIQHIARKLFRNYTVSVLFSLVKTHHKAVGGCRHPVCGHIRRKFTQFGQGLHLILVHHFHEALLNHARIEYLEQLRRVVGGIPRRQLRPFLDGELNLTRAVSIPHEIHAIFLHKRLNDFAQSLYSLLQLLVHLIQFHILIDRVLHIIRNVFNQLITPRLTITNVYESFERIMFRTEPF